MIKIGTSKAFSTIQGLPTKVMESIKESVDILESFYGVDRDIEADLGGYVAIIQSPSDIEELKENLLDIYEEIPELVERVTTCNNEVWLKLTFIMSSDYGIVVVGNTNDIEVNRINR